MSVSDKLTTIAENEQRVYDAGYSKAEQISLQLLNRTLTELSHDTLEAIGDYALRGCSALERINCPSVKTVGAYVHPTGTACTLREAYYPAAKSIGSNCFSSCLTLTDIDVSSVEDIAVGGFYKCTGLQNISLPKCTSIGKQAFDGCTALQAVVAPEVVTLAEKAFNGCTALEAVDAPLLETMPAASVFNGCTALAQVNMSNVSAIPASCFSNCKTLQTLDLHKASNIMANAFANCTALTALILRKQDGVCALAAWSAVNSSALVKTGYFYVPSALVDSYKSATNWASYADRFRAIEDYPDITGG